MAEAGSEDAFGHAQLGGVGPMIATLVKDRLGHKYHWAVADYLQRAARHLASKTDVEHAYAVGKAAVELALAGHNAVMPAIIRTSDKPYRWKIGVAPLDKVANVEKMLPRDYITRRRLRHHRQGARYLSPLIRGEDFPPFKDGLPQYVRLKNAAVPKKLALRFQDLTRPRVPADAQARSTITSRRYLRYAYLGHERFVEIAARHGATVAVKPVDYGRIFPVSGGLPLKQRAPQRQAYRLVELERWSKHLGKPLNVRPKFFPVSPDAAAKWIIARRAGARVLADARCASPGPVARRLGRGTRHIRRADACCPLPPRAADWTPRSRPPRRLQPDISVALRRADAGGDRSPDLRRADLRLSRRAVLGTRSARLFDRALAK